MARIPWWQLLSAFAFAFAWFGSSEAHVRLTYPPARTFALDFLDNFRTEGPCGMPNSGSSPVTSLKAGSTINVTWHLAYAHTGGYQLQILDSSDTVIRWLTPENQMIGMDDTTLQSSVVTIPSDLTCADCSLRLVRAASEWGSTYIFWSCANVNIKQPANYVQMCSGHGTWDGTKCQCERLYSCSECQCKDDCDTESDCNNFGTCVMTSSVTFPQKLCYCMAGRFGRYCEKKSSVASVEFDPEEYTVHRLSENYTLYYRPIYDIEEVEIIMQVKGTSYAAFGWRPPGLLSTCQSDFEDIQHFIAGEEVQESDGDSQGGSDSEAMAEQWGENIYREWAAQQQQEMGMDEAQFNTWLGEQANNWAIANGEPEGESAAYAWAEQEIEAYLWEKYVAWAEAEGQASSEQAYGVWLLSEMQAYAEGEGDGEATAEGEGGSDSDSMTDQWGEYIYREWAAQQQEEMGMDEAQFNAWLGEQADNWAIANGEPEGESAAYAWAEQEVMAYMWEKYESWALAEGHDPTGQEYVAWLGTQMQAWAESGGDGIGTSEGGGGSDSEAMAEQWGEYMYREWAAQQQQEMGMDEAQFNTWLGEQANNWAIANGEPEGESAAYAWAEQEIEAYLWEKYVAWAEAEGQASSEQAYGMWLLSEMQAYAEGEGDGEATAEGEGGSDSDSMTDQWGEYIYREWAAQQQQEMGMDEAQFNAWLGEQANNWAIANGEPEGESAAYAWAEQEVMAYMWEKYESWALAEGHDPTGQEYVAWLGTQMQAWAESGGDGVGTSEGGGGSDSEAMAEQWGEYMYREWAAQQQQEMEMDEAQFNAWLGEQANNWAIANGEPEGESAAYAWAEQEVEAYLWEKYEAWALAEGGPPSRQGYIMWTLSQMQAWAEGGGHGMGTSEAEGGSDSDSMWGEYLYREWAAQQQEEMGMDEAQFNAWHGEQANNWAIANGEPEGESAAYAWAEEEIEAYLWEKYVAWAEAEGQASSEPGYGMWLLSEMQAYAEGEGDGEATGEGEGGPDSDSMTDQWGEYIYREWAAQQQEEMGMDEAQFNAWLGEQANNWAIANGEPEGETAAYAWAEQEVEAYLWDKYEAVAEAEGQDSTGQGYATWVVSQVQEWAAGESEGEPDSDGESEGEGEPAGDDGSCPFWTGGLHPMYCTDMVIGSVIGSMSRILDYYSRDRSTPSTDDFWGGKNDLTAAVGEEKNGYTTILFRKPFDAKEPQDHSFKDQVMEVVWARGQEPDNLVHCPPSGIELGQAGDMNFYYPDTLKYHGIGSGQRGSASINFLGTPAPAPADCGGSWADTDGTYMAKWNYDPYNDMMSMEITTNTAATNWVAIGFTENPSMEDVDLVVGLPTGEVADMWIGSAYSRPVKDAEQNLESASVEYANGVATLKFTRRRNTGDSGQDVSFSDTDCFFFIYPVTGGMVINDAIQKHFRTPAISSQKICIKPCEEEDRGEQEVIMMQATVEFLIPYNEALSDPESAESVQVSQNLQPLIEEQLGNDVDGFLDMSSLEFTNSNSNGSTIANFVVEVEGTQDDFGMKRVQVEESLTDLTREGQIGDYPVDPQSVQVAVTSHVPYIPPRPSVPPVSETYIGSLTLVQFVIVVVLVITFVLTLAALCCLRCGESQRKKNMLAVNAAKNP